MSDNQRPPLWRVMFDARCAVTVKGHCKTGEAYAAEIRALRDWLVPDTGPPNPLSAISVHHWLLLNRDHERNQRIREALTAEAERAERG